MVILKELAYQVSRPSIRLELKGRGGAGHTHPRRLLILTVLVWCVTLRRVWLSLWCISHLEPE